MSLRELLNNSYLDFYLKLLKRCDISLYLFVWIYFFVGFKMEKTIARDCEIAEKEKKKPYGTTVEEALIMTGQYLVGL